jgi:hypothetical protein
VVNLHLTVPAHHPGARPPEYYSGVIWSIQHGAAALVHAAFGLALVPMVVAVAARAVAAGPLGDVHLRAGGAAW